MHVALDVVSPAAQYVPAGLPKGSPTNRPPMTVCDAYDSEAQQSMGRRWVKEHMEQGMSCHVNDAIVALTAVARTAQPVSLAHVRILRPDNFPVSPPHQAHTMGAKARDSIFSYALCFQFFRKKQTFLRIN